MSDLSNLEPKAKGEVKETPIVDQQVKKLSTNDRLELIEKELEDCKKRIAELEKANPKITTVTRRMQDKEFVSLDQLDSHNF